MRTVASLSLSLALGSCGSADGSELTFDDMTRDERLAFMATEVEPTFREIFQTYDPVRFADFGCDTCHGPGAAAAGYPKPEVAPALPRDNTLAAANAISPAGTAFMLDEVFPEMAAMLGREKYNADTAPDGFRCLGCHAEAPP